MADISRGAEHKFYPEKTTHMFPVIEYCKLPPCDMTRYDDQQFASLVRAMQVKLTS